MPTAKDKTTSEISFVYVVGRLNHGIRKDMRAHLGEWALSVPEFTALSILRRRPGLSNAQLARRTMVTPQSMIEILAGLENRDLVRRTVDPNHGRILRSELTAEGGRVVVAAQLRIDAMQDELLDGLPDDQRQLMLDGMLEAMHRLQSGR